MSDNFKQPNMFYIRVEFNGYAIIIKPWLMYIYIKQPITTLSVQKAWEKPILLN